MTEAKKCEFCDKSGLPILPVRYAVASVGTEAPRTTVPKIPLGDKTAYYTYRLVRSGYVYLYDLARDTWEAYFVTQEGYFFKIEAKPGVIPILPAKPFDCADERHRAIASCIMIPNASNASTVWIGFSDVLWTKDVFDRHQDAAYRERHMRVIDVKKGISGPDAQHMFPIKEIDTKVAEYAMEDLKLIKAFKWSPHPVDQRHSRAATLKSECERLKPGKGLVVTLDDPAGITQELAMLMHRNTRLLLEHPKTKRKLAVHGVISQLEMAIKDQAQKSAISKRQIDAAMLYPQDDLGVLFSDKYAKMKEKQMEELSTPTADELNKASTNAWQKYKAKFRHQETADWKAAFDKKKETYDANHVTPLALAHAKWMEHECMSDYFECNYDPKDIQNGAVYTTMFTQCVATTADKQPCFDVYAKWFQGENTSAKNLLLSALQFNNDEIKKKIQEATAASVSWKGMPWDKAIEAFDKATARLMTGHADAIGRLIGAMAGPTVAALRKSATEGKIYSGLVAIGGATKHPIVEVTVTGGRKAFRALLIKELLKLNGTKTGSISPHTLQKAMADELRRLKIHGVDLEGTQKKNWLLVIDPAEVKNMPKGLSATAQAQWLARTIRTPEQIDALNLGNHQMRVANWTAANRGAVPLAFGMLGVLANAVAFSSILEDDSKALSNTKNESLQRIYAQGAQFVGALASSMETAISRMSAPAFRAAAGVVAVVRRILNITGRFLGSVGSVFMGLIDIWRANNERLEGNTSGMYAYGISGVLGIAATIFLLVGWTGWGLIVVAAMVAWALIMPNFVDNKIQDWLERCDFGTFEQSQRYPDHDTEMREYKQALA